MLEEARVFSIEEANMLINHISLIFERIFDLSRRAQNLTKDINELLSIWGEDLLEKEHQDYGFYRAKIQKRARIHKEIKSLVKRVHDTGAIVKDVERGLVDFYHKTENSIVFLCWKYGESEIKYWHTIHGGIRGRRPIEELSDRVKPFF